MRSGNCVNGRFEGQKDGFGMVPPRHGLMRAPIAEPTASPPRSRVVRGTWPS